MLNDHGAVCTSCCCEFCKQKLTYLGNNDEKVTKWIDSTYDWLELQFQNQHILKTTLFGAYMVSFSDIVGAEASILVVLYQPFTRVYQFDLFVSQPLWRLEIYFLVGELWDGNTYLWTQKKLNIPLCLVNLRVCDRKILC